MKKPLCIALICACLSTSSAFAMSTSDFDAGMSKGINYYNRGLYYEAIDEFQWFCDANWGALNSGQQKYALDYLGGAKAKLQKYLSSNTQNNFYQSLTGEYRNYPDGRRPWVITISDVTHDGLTVDYFMPWVHPKCREFHFNRAVRQADGSYVAYGIYDGTNYNNGPILDVKIIIWINSNSDLEVDFGTLDWKLGSEGYVTYKKYN